MAKKPAETVLTLVRRGAAYGAAPALRGVGDQPAMTHAALAKQVGRLRRAMAGAGLKQGDVVLMGVRDGPVALTAFLALSTVATALPVPAQDQAGEYERLFAEVDIAAILIDDRSNAALAGLAAHYNLPLLRLRPKPKGPAGAAEIAVDRPRPAAELTRPRPRDIAILALTSGTTAAPKVVAVSHRSFLTSVRRFGALMGLGPMDRSLCMMPIAHMHSLVRTSLPVLSAGGEVVWAPGFDRRRAPGWIDRVQPTFLTGVPMIFRALAETAVQDGWRPSVPPRLLALGSDAVTEADVAAVERHLGARVAQFYGMTETSPTIAATPVAGSAGPATAAGRVTPDWQVTILDDQDRPVPVGVLGEIAVAGGFINPLVGRSSAGAVQRDGAGRFRTGDLGRLDEQGFLHVVGRVDDRITRAGHKIAPAVVEEAMEAMPAVARAVAFAEPHPLFGQQLALAVQPAPGATVTEAEVRAHAGKHLKSYMVPQSVHVVDRMPEGRVGKTSRRLLAEALAGAAPAAPGDPVAEGGSAKMVSNLLSLFRQKLDRPNLEPTADFFAEGGDSLTALEVLMEIEGTFGVSIAPAEFTVAGSADRLARTVETAIAEAPAVVLSDLRSGALQPALVVAHGVNGDAGFAPNLAEAMEVDQPIAALHARSRAALEREARSLEDLTTPYAALIDGRQAPGPVALAGFSLGAHVALAMAHHLLAAGRAVPLVAVLDDEADLGKRHFGAQRETEPLVFAEQKYAAALRHTPARPVAAHLIYFRAEENLADYRSDPTSGWEEIATGTVTIVDVPGDHHELVTADGLAFIGPRLQAELGQTRPTPPPPDAARMARYAIRQAARAGDLSTELDLTRHLIAEDPEQPAWLYANQVEALLQAGDPTAARGALEQAYARDQWPLSLDLRFLSAFQEHGFDDFIAAGRRRVEGTKLDHPSAYLQAARFHSMLRDHAAAEDVLRNGLAEQPTHVLMQQRLAGVLRYQKRWDEVLSRLEALVAQVPAQPIPQSQLVTAYLRNGMPDRALETADALVAHWPEFVGGLIAQADVLAGVGRYSAAEEVVRRATEIAPRHFRARRRHAEALKALGLKAEAEEARRRAAACPDAPDAWKARHGAAIEPDAPGA